MYAFSLGKQTKRAIMLSFFLVRVQLKLFQVLDYYAVNKKSEKTTKQNLTSFLEYFRFQRYYGRYYRNTSTFEKDFNRKSCHICTYLNYPLNMKNDFFLTSLKQNKLFVLILKLKSTNLELKKTFTFSFFNFIFMNKCLKTSNTKYQSMKLNGLNS